MANHAGFAAVAMVRDTTVQQTLRIFHSARLFPSGVSGLRTFANPIGSGSATVQYALFMDVPVVSFKASNAGRIAFDLRLFGTVTANAAGLGNLTRSVMLSTSIKARPLLVVLNGGVRVRLTAADIVVDSLNLSALVGGAIPPALNTLLNSPAARAGLGELIRAALTVLDTMTPPLFVPLLSRIGLGAAVSLGLLTPRVLDGALAIGLDLNPGTLSVATSGDFHAIKNFLSKSDIALCMNPVVVTLMTELIRPEVIAMAADEEVTVDSFSITLEAHNFYISGHATKDDFGATFSMRAQPKLGKPETVESYDDEYGGGYAVVNPGSEDIWLHVYDVDLDEELPGWLYFLLTIGTIVLLPWAPALLFAVAKIIDSIRLSIISQIEQGADDSISGSRVQRINLPATTYPFVDFTVSQLIAGSDGIQSRLWFTPDYGDAGQIVGPERLDVAEMVSQLLTYRLTPALNLYHPDDPIVRIRWQVRRTDTNAVVVTQDQQMLTPNADRVSLNLSTGDLSNCSKFTISCRVYRPLGSDVEELLNRTISLDISDRLDRTHPYVHWKHTVAIPQTEVFEGGQQEITGYNYINRQSAIHRTAFPGRCLFVAQYSEDVLPKDDASARPSLKYLDELPFPVSELAAHRDEICEYCFFGGPGKTVPLIT